MSGPHHADVPKPLLPGSDFYPGLVCGPEALHLPSPTCDFTLQALQVIGLHPQARLRGPPPSRASPAVSTLSFPPVLSVVEYGRPASYDAQGLRARLPDAATVAMAVAVVGTVAGLPPAEKAGVSPGRDARPPVGCDPHRPRPAPPTHKDSRCLSCCSCCASCRRRFCSRRRCSSCSGGSRGRRDPDPDDIATRGGLRKWKDTSSAPQRNPANVSPARAAELHRGTSSQAPAAPEACGNLS